MISGIWKDVKLICGNPEHGDQQLEMYIRQTTLEQEKAEDKKKYLHGKPDYAFYCCPHYDPESRSDDERPCFNRCSVGEIEKAMNMLSEKIEHDEETNGTSFIKNYKFSTKAADYKVKEAKGRSLVLQVIAHKAIR